MEKNPLACRRCCLRLLEPGPPSVAVTNSCWCTQASVSGCDLPVRQSELDPFLSVCAIEEVNLLLYCQEAVWIVYMPDMTKAGPASAAGSVSKST